MHNAFISSLKAILLGAILPLFLTGSAFAKSSIPAPHITDIKDHHTADKIYSFVNEEIIFIPPPGNFAPDDPISPWDFIDWLRQAIPSHNWRLPPVLPVKNLNVLQLKYWLALNFDPKCDQCSFWVSRSLRDLALQKSIMDLVKGGQDPLEFSRITRIISRAEAVSIIHDLRALLDDYHGIQREENTSRKPFVAMYYMESNRAFAALDTNKDSIDWISYWYYRVNSDGSLWGDDNYLDPDKNYRLLQWAQDNDKPILLMLVGHSHSTNRKFLTNRNVWPVLTGQVKEVLAGGRYDGVEINFEGVPADLRQDFTDFVCFAANELRSLGYTLNLSIMAKTSDMPKNSLVGAYDYAGLAQCSDYITLMTYDFHWPGGTPGPVGPLAWMDSVLAYATSVIPAKQIMIGIPAYGYEWVDAGQGRGITGRRAEIKAARAANTFMPHIGETQVVYKDENQEREWIAYYTPPQGLELKLSLVSKYNTGGIMMWRIGQEPDSYWPVIRDLKNQDLQH